jgi:hypothetical protein
VPDPLFDKYTNGLGTPATTHQTIVAGGGDLAQFTQFIMSDVAGTVTGILSGPGEASFTITLVPSQMYKLRFRVISAFSGGAGTLHGFA